MGGGTDVGTLELHEWGSSAALLGALWSRPYSQSAQEKWPNIPKRGVSDPLVWMV